LITNVTLWDSRLRIGLDCTALAAAAKLKADDLHASLCSIDVPFTCRRRGVETKIVAGDRIPAPDKFLIRALRNAHIWSEALRSGIPLRKLALRERHSERYMARVITMISLAPSIQSAILEGTQPVDLSLERLVRCHIPLDWDLQAHLFGMDT
jgi:site-specific DNA recombinase